MRSTPAAPVSSVSPLWRSAAAIALVAAIGVLSASAEGPAQRVVSLNPSLTQILVALGARDALVGVDDFSAKQQPEVAGLPRVGGLFNPSLEAVLALEPDLVVLVPSVEQRDFRERLEELQVRVSVFDNIGFAQVLENIDRLGALVGRQAQAAARIEAIRAVRDAVAGATAGRSSPRTVAVLQREPVFVVGRGSFLDEMLGAVGAQNLGRAFEAPYPRVSVEWLIAAAPDVLLDLTGEPGDAAAFWSRWPTLPAVRSGRVLGLVPEEISLPGPHLDRSLAILAVALYGPEIEDEIEAQRSLASGSPH